jgi:hypothetical protein
MAEALTDALEAVEVTPTTVEAEAPAAATYKDGLVGEGKKFAKDEELAKAYHHANLHIEELKSDLDEYKGGKELLNEVLSEIRNSSTEESVDTSPLPQGPVEAQIQSEDVAKIVSAEFIKKEQEAEAKANVSESFKLLTELYGGAGQAKAAVAKTINGDDHIKGVIDNLSLTNPAAMAKFVTGMTPAAEAAEGNTPGVNEGSMAAPPPAGLTWSKCRDIRKENPRLYKSQEFRRSIEAASAAASAKGIDFFAT